MQKVISRIIRSNDGKNVILSLSSKAIAMLLFLITDILVVKLLTFQEYDEWSFFYSLVTILYSVAWFGIDTSTRVYVARTAEKSEKNSYIFSGVRVRFRISIIIFIILIFLAIPLSNWLGYPTRYPNLQFLLFCAPLLVFGNSFIDFIKELNVGLVLFRNTFVISILEFGGYLLFGISGIFLLGSIKGLGIGYIFSSAFTLIIGGYLLLRHLKVNTQKEYMKLDKTKCGEIFKYAIPVFISSLIGSLLMEMDIFMLGLLQSPGQTGIYSIAKSLMTKATNINLAVCTSTMTAFAIITHENYIQKYKYYKKILFLNSAFILLICLSVLIGGSMIINLLYGTEYERSSDILKILLFYYAFFATSIFPSTLLYYQGKAQKILKYYVVMLLCNIVLNYALIPFYGAIGAAVAVDLSILPYTILMLSSGFRIFQDFALPNKRRVNHRQK